jgi:hypothetical protein
VDPIDEIFRSIQPHPSRAQILLEVEDEGKTLEKALGILEANGVQPIEYDFIRKGDPSFVLFYLSTNDMRGATLNLTEAGFTRLKAISSKEANLKNK